MTVFPRLTVGAEVVLQGVGLHSGEPARARVSPGERGVRLLHDGAWVAARPENVTDTQRCTRLGGVAMVEHLLSALAGLGLTDADIEVQGNELPGFDGSARVYAELLAVAGNQSVGSLQVEGPYARVYSVDGDSQVSVATGEGLWRYDFDLGSVGLGMQSAEAHLTPETYREQVAPARTTVFEREVEAARKMGLGRGLTEDDVVVIRDGGYRGDLRMPEEPARHKLLDLVGDLSLAGVPVGGLRVVGLRSGHRANVAAAAKLTAHVTVVATRDSV